MKKLMTRVALIGLATFTIGSSISAIAAIREGQESKIQQQERVLRVSVTSPSVRLNERRDVANTIANNRLWPWPGSWLIRNRQVFDRERGAFRDGDRNDLRDRPTVGYFNRSSGNLRGGPVYNRLLTSRISIRLYKDSYVSRRAREGSRKDEQANFIAQRLGEQDRQKLFASLQRSQLRENDG